MKAIYIAEPGQICLQEVPRPGRNPGEALIKVRSLGICGSDVSAYKGTNPTMTYPRILGHEIAGEILEIDANETGIKVGDRVVLEPYFSCGHCYPCSLGFINNCETMNVLGVRMEGGMTEEISHPVKYLHKVPAQLGWDQAAMIEPLSISLHVVHRAAVKPGETVVITGAGAIGLLAAKVCLAYGAAPILIDPVDARLQLANAQGVVHTINPVRQQVADIIHTLTAGKMAAVVLECSGANAAIQDAAKYAANSGRIVFVGWPKAEVALPVPLFIRKELNIFGSRNSAREFPESIELIATGRVDVSSVITKTVSLAEIPAAIIELADHPDRYLKIVALQS